MLNNDLKKARKILKEHDIDEKLADYYYNYLCNNNLFHKGVFFDGINRLCNGEPIQYIIGNVDFYGNIIKVDKNVLIPRFETEELIFYTKEYIDKYFNKKVDILDIGTGSGNIAITLKKIFLAARITAIDISKEALVLARENAKYNNVEINFLESDIYENVVGKFDVIISNPPYLKKDEQIMSIVYQNEPHIALFAEENGLYFYKKILENAKYYLKNKYLIAFEIGLNQEIDISNLAKKYLGNPDIDIKKDMQGRKRFIFINNLNKK